MRSLVLLGLVSLAGLQGCSVVLAAQGSPSPNLGEVKKNKSRGEIELILGAATAVTSTPEGQSRAVYVVTVGDEPSPGAAVGHAIGDLLTAFLWELVGWPIELSRGEEVTVNVLYDESDNVVSVSSTRS